MNAKRSVIVIDLTSKDELSITQSTKRHRSTWTGVDLVLKKVETSNAVKTISNGTQTATGSETLNTVLKCPICLEINDAVFVTIHRSITSYYQYY